MATRRRAGRPTPSLDVVVTDGRGRRLAGTGLERWLPGAAPRSARGHVVVAVVSNRKMRELNRRYRGADYATDVLSFPAEPPPERASAAGRLLGDIVIARGRAERQARTFGHAVGVELRILALHGLIHLLGYDHETDHGRMQRVEERLRQRAGLPVGLTARGARTTPHR
jgi:probable rRNA maturation factor